MQLLYSTDVESLWNPLFVNIQTLSVWTITDMSDMESQDSSVSRAEEIKVLANEAFKGLLFWFEVLILQAISMLVCQ